jgi:hypothetical protein
MERRQPLPIETKLLQTVRHVPKILSRALGLDPDPKWRGHNLAEIRLLALYFKN